jgi:hypothetical protein
MSINGRGEMTSKLSQGGLDGRFLGFLRAAALIVVLGGAAGSLGFMFRAGHRQNSRILLLIFAIWVLSPFMALVLAHLISTRWSAPIRATLYSVMLVLTLASLAIYGDVALGHATLKVGFVFLVVPPASCLLIAIAIAIAALISRRLSCRGAGS